MQNNASTVGLQRLVSHRLLPQRAQNLVEKQHVPSSNVRKNVVSALRLGKEYEDFKEKEMHGRCYQERLHGRGSQGRI